MHSMRETLVEVETLKNILVGRAVGQMSPGAPDEYIELRRELVTDPQLQNHLPRFVVSCRTLQEFWDFIKTRFAHYDERREFLKNEFEPVINLLELGSQDGISPIPGDLFRRQFPAGLPFGLAKPNLAFVPEKGTQVARFEDAADVGVLRENVYPDLTFENLQDHLRGKPFIISFPALLRICQTQRERELFLSYEATYQMQSERVPVLIPQAWIQWHSKTKADLRSQGSSYAADLYRVDFVAFWNHKRFAILVDDISHYAKKMGGRWDADEEAYSKRLKEDRKLRKEGWEVFRVGNWELHREADESEILSDLQEHLGF